MGTHTADLRIFFILGLLSLLVLLLASISIGAETYLDHEIVILENGAATIVGSSSVVASGIVPANDTISKFETNSLTSKKGDYWTFEYQTESIVSVSLVKIHLPANAVVNYVKSPSATFIESGDTILLTFTDSNQPVNITIQYSFKSTPTSKSSINLDFKNYFADENRKYALIALACALFIVLFGIVVIIARRRNPSLTRIQTAVSGIDIKKLNTFKLTLNETQIKIIDALLEREGKATQNAIAHHTQIPKASLSRNVDLLVQKQILVKHAGGYTNQLRFHESLILADKS